MSKTLTKKEKRSLNQHLMNNRPSELTDQIIKTACPRWNGDSTFKMHCIHQCLIKNRKLFPNVKSKWIKGTVYLSYDDDVQKGKMINS